MSSKTVSVQWRRRIEARLSGLEERLRLGLKGEQRSRELDGAHTDEEIEELTRRVDSVVAEYESIVKRLRWVESRIPTGRPPKKT